MRSDAPDQTKEDFVILSSTKVREMPSQGHCSAAGNLARRGQ
nr:hypothetical protein [Salinisphaera hydrothermalis]